MKILITGGAGYVGSMLVQKLASYGHDIYIVDLCIYDTKLNLSQKNITLYKSDIRYFDWKIILERHIDVVYHLASISNDPGYGGSETVGESVNYIATIRLYDECIRYQVSKFIYPSSCSVYGRQINKDILLTEENLVNPLTNYARLKIKVEEYIQSNPKINYTILRPATVYGYSFRQRFDLVINSFIAHIYYGKNVAVSDVNNIRPCVYINDLVDIYIRFLGYDKIDKQIYNVVAQNNSLIETFQLIKGILNSKSCLLNENNEFSRSYRVCADKILKLFPDFSYSPFRKGIQTLVDKFNEGIFYDYEINSNYYGKMRQPVFFSGDK